jgi:hypothetical protein
MLDQPDGLAEHGPADAVALKQLRFRADQPSYRPAHGYDVTDNPVGDLFRSLGGRARARPGR